MMRKFKKLFLTYIKTSANSAIWDFFFGLLISSVVTFLLKEQLSALEIKNLALQVLILAAVFFSLNILFLFLNIRPNRYVYNILSVDIIVEYSGDRMDVYETYTVRSNRIHARKLYTRREWFPREKRHLKILTKGYSLEKIDNGDPNKDEYYIVFPKPLRFHEPQTFKVHFSGYNKTRQCQNYYWYTVLCPTDYISIDVHIPLKFCTNKIKMYYFYDQNKNSQHREVTEYNNYQGAYKWEIENPKVGWSVSYDWEWSPSEQAIISRHRNKA